MQYLPQGFEPACKRTEYWLVLNLMRDRAESQRGFGPFASATDALSYHDAELAAEPWTDGGFRKVFRQGSELEWMNPLDASEREHIGVFGHGVYMIPKYYDDPFVAPPLRSVLPAPASVDTHAER